MARIRHIAMTTDDPAKTAEFYKQFFGLTELFRQPKDTGELGVWLSDGYIYFAILKFGSPGTPNLGPGHTSTLRGLHHIGFEVENQAAVMEALEAANVPPLLEPGDGQQPMLQHSRAHNAKYLGPDAVQFDVRERGWNEAIQSKMQLYTLTPVRGS